MKPEPTACARWLAERERADRRPEKRGCVFSRDDGHVWADGSGGPQWIEYRLFRSLRRAGFRDVDYRLH
jgi:hypothetical protein